MERRSENLGLKEIVIRDVREKLVMSPNMTDEEVLFIINDIITYRTRLDAISLNARRRLCREVFNSLRRLDVLQNLLDDDSITEIMVNGTDEIYIERGGALYKSGVRFESKERLMDIISQIASKVNRTVNMSNPILDARLTDGSRVNVVLEPIALNGPILTIRRFPNTPLSVGELIKRGSVSEEIMTVLRNLVIAGYNILISGSTGSGKTTFLNCLSSFIPSDERIITIEDSAELRIIGVGNLVRLEVRCNAMEGVKEISIRDLIKTALRMRPDRVIVGEVRGEEAIDMLQAFNVGQDGSLSTIHANSARDALSRLETMVMLNTDIPLSALRRQIASGVDIIIHLSRLRDKSRRLMEIIEVVGMEDNEIKTSKLYEFVEESVDGERTNVERIKGNFRKVNNLINTYKLEMAGIKVFE